MLVLTLSLPLVGGLTNFFTGKTGTKGSTVLGCLSMAAAFCCLLFITYEVTLIGSPVILSTIGDWYSTSSGRMEWGIVVDSVTCIMLIAVYTVSGLVHVYSLWYMSGDPHNSRFFMLISLFTFFIALLVIGSTIPMMFVGWEGIGVVSYLLISFWFTRGNALQSAIQAFLLNRVGDLALILGMALFATTSSSLVFSTLSITQPFISSTAEGIALALIMIGAAGKSAQLGLQAWLPNAIEAPTPVSALIHAATLVTAGVYLMIRSSSMLALVPSLLAALALLGAFTSLFAGVTGLRQMDLKRIIAFSTCSQVAYMILAVGSGANTYGLFLLVTHAFYKALLFLGAGAVLHAIAGIQDIRLIGGVGKAMPLVSAAMLVGAAALGAAPYTSGDFSKDIIIELQLGPGIVLHNLVWLLAVTSAGLTLYYSARLHRLTFGAEPRGNVGTTALLHDPSSFITLPVVLFLTVASIGFGFLARDVFEPSSGALGLNQWAPAFNMVDTESTLSGITALMPLLASAIGLTLGSLSLPSRPSPDFLAIQHNLQVLSQTKWGFDSALNQATIRPALGVALSSYKSLDRGLFELVGPFGATRVLINLTRSRVFAAFSLADLTLFLAAFTVLLTCFSWEASSLVTLLALGGITVTTVKPT